MKSQSVIAGIVVVLLLVLAGGIIWLSHASMMPPAQKMELAIPDERIPH